MLRLQGITTQLVVTPVDNSHRLTSDLLVGKTERHGWLDHSLNGSGNNHLVCRTSTNGQKCPTAAPVRRPGHVRKAVGLLVGSPPRIDERLRAGPEVGVTSAWQLRIADGHQP
jgi:hypothetical protein